MEERTTGYTTKYLKYVSTGACPGCQECCDSHGYEDIEQFNQDVENGEISDEGSFSWSPCDECSTSLGGDSFVAHGIDDNEDLAHFTVCIDCLMELNGYIYNKELGCYE
jgi:hypothetical protein